MKKIETPNFNFWDLDLPKINYVNTSDFDKKDLLSGLGLQHHPLVNSFGITDKREIVKRQELLKFFIKNEELRKLVINGLDNSARIPNKGNEFLSYFKEAGTINIFWTKVIKILNAFPEKKVPSPLKEFVEFMGSSYEDAFENETVFVKKMTDEILKATALTGTVILETETDFYRKKFSLTRSKVFGYRKYAMGISKDGKQLSYPNWIGKILPKYLGVSFLAKKIVDHKNYLRNRSKYSAQVINFMPDALSGAIEYFINQNVSTSDLDAKYAKIELYFSYDEEGLHIRPINFSLSSEFNYSKKDKKPAGFNEFFVNNYTSFKGYSYLQNFLFSKRMRSYSNKIRKKEQLMKFYNSFDGIGFNQGDAIYIKNPEVEQIFRWYALERIQEQGILIKEYETVKSYREFVNQQIIILGEIAQIADIFVKKRKKWNISFEFPKILDDSRHEVSFVKIYPIHLIGRNDSKKEEVNSSKYRIQSSDLIPVKNLPKLNGQMIGITGQNSGGKTVTKETYINTIFLAQSGFPIFGKQIRLNTKSTLAMVFMERGHGSTVQLLLEKVNNVLDVALKSPRNSVVAFIDELGTGTQESLGLEKGKLILEKISGTGASVIFSTQITELAKYAESELETLCFKLDLNYKIAAGIGTGGIDDLIEKMELEHLK
jgi:hypothetical protein